MEQWYGKTLIDFSRRWIRPVTGYIYSHGWGRGQSSPGGRASPTPPALSITHYRKEGFEREATVVNRGRKKQDCPRHQEWLLILQSKLLGRRPSPLRSIQQTSRVGQTSWACHQDLARANSPNPLPWDWIVDSALDSPVSWPLLFLVPHGESIPEDVGVSYFHFDLPTRET